MSGNVLERLVASEEGLGGRQPREVRRRVVVEQVGRTRTENLVHGGKQSISSVNVMMCSLVWL